MAFSNPKKRPQPLFGSLYSDPVSELFTKLVSWNNGTWTLNPSSAHINNPKDSWFAMWHHENCSPLKDFKP